jgi:hypothetical protein
MDMLSASYRDRQFITVLDRGSNPTEPVEIKLRDYIGLQKQKEAWATFLSNPKNLLTKRHWTDTKNWGVYGYAFDKVRGNNRSDSGSVRHVQKVPAEIAEHILQFPPGHPLYSVVYAGHPLKAPVYMPVSYFHRVLFQEKLNELLTLLYSLGAVEVTIHYLRGYAESFGAKGGVSLPLEIPIQAGSSFCRASTSRTEGILRANFKPERLPHVPESPVWYEHEATWMRVAQARLTAGLKEIDVELRYDDDFGVNAEVALKLSEFGFKLGGAFSKHEETAWEFHAAF